MTRHRCNLDLWASAQSRGDGYRSLVTPERVLSEKMEDLIFLCFTGLLLHHPCLSITQSPLVLKATTVEADVEFQEVFEKMKR